MKYAVFFLLWSLLLAGCGGEDLTPRDSIQVDLPATGEVESTYVTAVDWYLYGETHDLFEAQLGLDFASLENWSESDNHHAALDAYQRAVTQGDATAQYELGRLLEEGALVEPSAPEALKWYRMAAEGGDDRAEQRIEALEKSARAEAAAVRARSEDRDPAAQRRLGLMYRYGYGVLRNDVTARAWLHRAAQQGDSRAQLHLGIMLLEGEGGAESSDDALYWFNAAAEAGYPRAHRNLGLIYFHGRGVERDCTQALEHFRSAASPDGDDSSRISSVPWKPMGFDNFGGFPNKKKISP